MGDNYRSARAYPQNEGKCEVCGRWIAISHISPHSAGEVTVHRHKCVDEKMTSGRRAIDTHYPKELQS